MNKKILQYEMHLSYGHIGDNVYFTFEVEYDWPSIVANDFNSTNFVITPIGFKSNTIAYLQQSNISTEAWSKTAISQLMHGCAQELFNESIPEDMYTQYAKARGWR